jgi:hypothetical protein
MKNNRIIPLLALLWLGLSAGTVLGQSAMRGLHGTIQEDRMGLHAGNKFHVTFFNDGTYGVTAGDVVAQEVRGTWPDDYYGLRHNYMIDGNIFIVSEVIDDNGKVQHIHSTVRGPGDGTATSWSSGDMSPTG